MRDRKEKEEPWSKGIGRTEECGDERDLLGWTRMRSGSDDGDTI